MGYFSNGAEGMDYQERYCCKCVHDIHSNCPVWGLQLAFNAERFNNKHVGECLDQLIPRSTDHLSNDQCRMFLVSPCEQSRGAD
jgi:hypothetical protein